MTTATLMKKPTTRLNSAKAIEKFISKIPTPEYAPIEDDIEFLEKVLVELDASWVTGTMCDLEGKKCLVGAGAYFSGAIYFPVRAVENAIDNLYDIQEESQNLQDAINWVASMDTRNNVIETEVAVRLYDLLDFETFVIEGMGEDHLPTNDHGKLDTVIETNDNEGYFTDTLRPLIVAAIARLRG